MSNQIKREIDNVPIPSDIRNRSVSGIQMAKQELKYEKSNNKARGTRKKLIAAALSAAIVTVGIGSNYTTLAGMIGGYFQDIRNWKGAVVGLKYIDATEEILIEADEINMDSDNITVGMKVKLLKDDVAPYNITQVITFGEYSVVTGSG
ncbi:hypothetical protein [Lutispora thermophila]|uniref:DUF4179 domain-containing protein n=1 Tax=Lutispora thermophila DSM 19022 TaxID=1122184 RepID=A0A1M6HDE4_9FIRM|nr:hypothetical protein [Lutispora thermophila]SHJ20149.1 hypothetical protein SAMN02745176_02753 [Lutispora thermophila DSM 19022]